MAEARSDQELERLVELAIGDDGEAWQQLWRTLEPRLLALLAKPRISGSLCESEDERRNMATEVMARLRDDNHRRLKLYLAARARKPGLKFMPWLIIVTKRTAVDYQRAHDLYLDRRGERDASAAGKWVVSATLPSASALGGSRPPVTLRATAHEMLRYAGAELSVEHHRALTLWLQGVGHADIAAHLGLTAARDAERLVRTGLVRLRRHFREAAREDDQ